MKAAAVALALLLATSATAADFNQNAIGTTGSEFLQQEIGARGIAMGGAYSAVTNDVYSLYWNPAGLAKIPRVSASFMYTDYVADISYQSGAVAARVNDIGVLAAGFRYVDYGSVENTDISGNNLGNFQPRDYVAEAGWGQSVYDLSDSEVDVNVGVAGRWLHSDYLLSANGYSGDIGLQARFYHGNYAYDFGFVAQNMGVGERFDQTRDTLPFQLRLGGAMEPIKNLTVSMEAVMPSDNLAYGAAGLEYAAQISRNMRAAARAGFNSDTLLSLGIPSTFSCGAGLTIADFTVDYSFVPFGILGNVQQVSISWNLPAKASSLYRERE